MRAEVLKPRWVESLPASLEEGVLYLAKNRRMGIHLCPCGCRQQVATTFGESGWRLSYWLGKATLHPSIGNWSQPCQSHYFIRKNRVVWSGRMSKADIHRNEAWDRAAFNKQYGDPSGR